MGLHTGEPRLGGERYVGLGVHKAARIAAAGHGGQVLLSRTTRELVEDELPPGVTLRDLGERRLKDLDRPEHLSQLVIEGLPSEFARLKTLDVELRRKRRLMYLGSAVIGVLAAAVAIPVFALSQGGSGSVAVAPNSVAVIDAGSNKVVRSVPVGVRPSAIAFGNGSLWVANTDDRTLARIDPETRLVQGYVPLQVTPTGVAVRPGSVWVANGVAGSVSRVDPGTNQVTLTRPVTRHTTFGAVDVGKGSVWVAYSNALVASIDPVQGRVSASGVAGTNPTAVKVGADGVWVANAADSTVSKILPATVTQLRAFPVGRHPDGIAIGAGAVWVTGQGDNTVTRIDLGAGSEATIPVGHGPTGIAFGAGAVWVANSDDGTISKIDPQEPRDVRTIPVGNRPVGVAIANGRVWVTVQAPIT
jgi:YVTN family beta-propeller protein